MEIRGATDACIAGLTPRRACGGNSFASGKSSSDSAVCSRKLASTASFVTNTYLSRAFESSISNGRKRPAILASFASPLSILAKAAEVHGAVERDFICTLSLHGATETSREVSSGSRRATSISSCERGSTVMLSVSPFAIINSSESQTVATFWYSYPA